MEVAHRQDHITHAVIGGGQAIEFGISSSAEFFNILSSTLYKDQILAVVREVLCNAWDAHIEAGVTDRSVEITLTRDKFVIRDFGKGIHNDDMGIIYGTYGNSTKKNDGMQTGGFGLGCKAPFAYIDHFEVISSHEGVRTIYNLSKSSAAAMGKPGIVKIAAFTTTESGLQVSIGIKTNEDYERFGKLIKRIASNGDMNMLLNGSHIIPIGFKTNEANYMLMLNSSLLDTQSIIMVRYGNVVYPVDKVDAIRDLYNKITNHLLGLNGGRYQEYQIVFQAPPHSISVTPSRESLSMQEHTIKTLNSLFQGFVDTLNTGFKKSCDEFAETVIQNAVNDAVVPLLLNREERLPIKSMSDFLPNQINDLGVMAKQYMTKNYPKSLEFRKQDISWRLKKMADAGLLNRGLVQTFLRDMKSVRITNQRRWGQSPVEKNTWLQKQIIAPLMTKLLKAGIDHTRLFIHDVDDVSANTKYGKVAPLVEASKACPAHLFMALPYLRNIIVIGTSRSDIKDRAKRHPVMKELGDQEGFFFYHASMSKIQREEAIAFFKQSEMEVIDLTIRQDWEPTTQRVAIPVVRKPVKKGLVALTSIREGKGINTRNSREEDADRIIDPEFVMLVPVNKDLRYNQLEKWDREASGYIVDLFGDKGGVVTNTPMYDKWIAKGVKDGEAYILEKLCNFMMTNPRLQEFIAFDPARAQMEYRFSYDTNELVQAVYVNPLLRNEFGLVNNLTDEDHKYLFLWRDYLSRFPHYRSPPPEVAAVKVHLSTIPLDPANGVLLKKFIGNKLLPMINSNGLFTILRTEDPTSPTVKNAIHILTTVINS